MIGIGINVHQRSFDPDLSTPATSLDIEAGRTHQPPGAADRPAKIAAARDAGRCRTRVACSDSGARSVHVHVDFEPSG